MANSATLASLETLVRIDLNLTNQTNVITSAEVQLLLLAELNVLRETLIQRDRGYFGARYKISLVANQEEYAMPADFERLVSAQLLFGVQPNQRRMEMKPFNWNEYNGTPLGLLPNPSWPVMYRLFALSDGTPRIIFSPICQQSFNNAIELIYVPQFVPPATATTTIAPGLPNGWERPVEFATCVRIAARRNQAEHFAAYTKLRDEAIENLIKASSVRDEEPYVMVDVYETSYWPFGSPGDGT